MTAAKGLRTAVLVSGSGTNLQAIIDHAAAGTLGIRLAGVISDRPGVLALERATRAGIPAQTIDHARAGSSAAFQQQLAGALAALEPELVVLAGFMRILGEGFVRRYAGRLLNIHPSLLPAFPGLHTHRRALEAGCKLVGATVHFVTSELDHGPIVMQSAVPVLPGDDEERLAERVLATEHVIYPQAVRWFVEGQLRLDGARVHHLGGASQVLM